MGAGRRTHTAQIDSSTIEAKIVKRSLGKEELGGVIFHCNNDTMEECLSRLLFGLPKGHFDYVKHIEKGMPLFLFNIDGRLLYGVFKAAEDARDCFNMHPDAWSGGSSKISRFPAQVPVTLERQCRPIPENEFSKYISYYGRGRFLNELTKPEVHNLFNLFKASHANFNLGGSQAKVPATIHSASSSSSIKPGTSWKQVAAPNNNKPQKPNAPPPPPENKKPVPVSSGRISVGEVTYAGQVRGFEDEMKHHVASTVAEVVLHNPEPEEKLVFQNHEEKAMFQNKAAPPEKPKKSDSDTEFQALLQKLTVEPSEQEMTADQMTVKGGGGLADASDELSALREEVNEFRVRQGNRHKQLDETIYMMGGFDGSERLTSVQVLRANTGGGNISIKSVSPLLRPRSCATSVALNGEIYVIGGVTGASDEVLWSKSVEKYHAWLDGWSSCTEMNLARGMLAAANVKDRIYAIGGRNCNTFYSDVEWHDPNLAAWLPSAPLLEPRCSMAAATVEGAIYVIGGTDGEHFLSTMERLDPRVSTWHRAANMSTNRVWFSAGEIQGKIYAVGGYDGKRYLNSVECYDPRADKWEFVASLRSPRAHSGAAVLGDVIYILNGLDMNQDYMNTVELFNPNGDSWWNLCLPELKCRTLMSVAVL